MMLSSTSLIVTLACLQLAAAQSSSNPFNLVSAATTFTGGKSPIVNTGYAKFQGIQDDHTGTSNYLGIKFAHAPRFNHSYLADQPIGGVQNVSDYGPACPQHELTSEIAPNDFGIGGLTGLLEAAILSPALRQDEDCLMINVQRPQKIKSGKKLPVLVWIHGRGFESGASSSLISEDSIGPGVVYQGANLVKRSTDMGQPIIFTSIQYRLNNFGFSASKEMKKAGLLNLGLEDQRNAFRWIKKHISSFGGDPDRVTIMGESAGSWSVTGHLVANNGNNEGLFHGAVGISGGPVKVDGPERQQPTFDAMVDYVGCSKASDKIKCLQKADYNKLYAVMQKTNYFIGYRSLASAWTLRPDGKLLTDSPDNLVAQGKIANVPLMYGDMLDEGTLFSQINSLNTTTKQQVADYFRTYWWPKITTKQMNKLLELYPQNPTKGSPFGTGLEYAVPLQYKRISAITGDYSFQVQRRQLLDKAPQAKWNYLTEQAVPASLLEGKGVGGTLGKTKFTAIPLLGSFHASDVILNFFGTIPGHVSKNSYHLMGVLISFVNHGDPNRHGMSDLPLWPKFDKKARDTMHFHEQNAAEIVKDTYRKEQMEYINSIGDSMRI